MLLANLARLTRGAFPPPAPSVSVRSFSLHLWRQRRRTRAALVTTRFAAEGLVCDGGVKALERDSLARCVYPDTKQNTHTHQRERERETRGLAVGARLLCCWAERSRCRVSVAPCTSASSARSFWLRVCFHWKHTDDSQGALKSGPNAKKRGERERETAPMGGRDEEVGRRARRWGGGRSDLV